MTTFFEKLKKCFRGQQCEDTEAEKEMNNVIIPHGASIKFVRRFQNRIDWTELSYHYTLSIEFVRAFQDKIDWNAFSYNTNISTEIIREFQDRLEWVNMSLNWGLTVRMAREFQDKLDWKFVGLNSGTSVDFIMAFKDKLNLSPAELVDNRIRVEDSLHKRQANLRLSRYKL